MRSLLLLSLALSPAAAWAGPGAGGNKLDLGDLLGPPIPGPSAFSAVAGAGVAPTPPCPCIHEPGLVTTVPSCGNLVPTTNTRCGVDKYDRMNRLVVKSLQQMNGVRDKIATDLSCLLGVTVTPADVTDMLGRLARATCDASSPRLFGVSCDASRGTSGEFDSDPLDLILNPNSPQLRPQAGHPDRYVLPGGPITPYTVYGTIALRDTAFPPSTLDPRGFTDYANTIVHELTHALTDNLARKKGASSQPYRLGAGCTMGNYINATHARCSMGGSKLDPPQMVRHMKDMRIRPFAGALPSFTAAKARNPALSQQQYDACANLRTDPYDEPSTNWETVCGPVVEISAGWRYEGFARSVAHAVTSTNCAQSIPDLRNAF